jgi:hypothetical protein
MMVHEQKKGTQAIISAAVQGQAHRGATEIQGIAHNIQAKQRKY